MLSARAALILYVHAALRWAPGPGRISGTPAGPSANQRCETGRFRPELRGKGPSTPSQTSWALMGLIEVGEAECREARRGVQYLLDQQQSDGSWEELHFTGTGFPRHFFIRYHDYRNCFPLMALGQYRQALNSKGQRD